jgi:hypothetical protein
MQHCFKALKKLLGYLGFFNQVLVWFMDKISICNSEFIIVDWLYVFKNYFNYINYVI